MSNQRDVQREAFEANVSGFEFRTFSCILGLLLALTTIASLIYIFSFADTNLDRLTHAYHSCLALAPLVLLFSFIYRLELRHPLPVYYRKIALVTFITSPIVDILALVSYLLAFGGIAGIIVLLQTVAALPLFRIAWTALKRLQHGNRTPTPPSGMAHL